MRAIAQRVILLVATAGVQAPIAAAQPADATPAQAEVERDRNDLVLLAPGRPVFVRIYTRVDGKSLRTLRFSRASALLNDHDRNGDGALDRDEARRVPAFARSPDAPESFSLDEGWVSVDNNPADDRVTALELADYFDRIVGAPFVLSVRAQRVTQAVDLFSLLDVDRDLRLTAGEIASARATLRKLDLDDDETLTIEELQPFRNPQAPAVEPQARADAADQPFVLLSDAAARSAAAIVLQARYGNAGSSGDAGLPAEALGVEPQVFAKHDTDRDGHLTGDELASLLAEVEPQLEMDVELTMTGRGRPKLGVTHDALQLTSAAPARPSERFILTAGGISVEWRATGSNVPAATDNRKFYQLRFLSSDRDKNKYLDEQEFAAVALPNAEFKAVDRNSDGMITQDELLAAVEQEAASSQSRVEMTVSYDGKSVFELLDANSDRRMSRRELVAASERLVAYDRDRDGVLTAVELVGRYRAAIEPGKPALFQRQAMTRETPTAPLVNAPSAGPEWFRKMDRNRDGDVSLKEFVGPLGAFRKLDGDGDGLISAREAESAVQATARE